MPHLRHHFRRWTWLALIAVMGMALLPSLSHALMASKGGPWMEVCSAQGSRWVQVSDDAVLGDQQKPASGDLSAPHCPLCCHQSHAVGLPPVGGRTLPKLQVDSVVPPLLLQVPRPVIQWAVAQPRGPPRSA